MEMLETIETLDLPQEYTVTYETKGVHNIVTNRFVKLPDNTTRCITETEFRFRGFMRIMAFFMQGSFKKQSLKYLEDFREFAEDTIPGKPEA
jgi:hypothetical protein